MNLPGLNIDLSQFPESINDIRDKYFDGEPMSIEERTALENFDKFRMNYLNASSNDEEFEKRYLEIQAKANLASYKEFLNIEELFTLNGL